MTNDKLADLYSGIETIKTVVVVDNKYHAKKVWFSRPAIIVFTNVLGVDLLVQAVIINIITV